MATNPLRMDPSRTLGIQRAFSKDFDKRINRLLKALLGLVRDEDVFGLGDKTTRITLNTRWKFRTSDEKLKAFRDWFKLQVDAGFLEVDRERKPWTSKYVESAYKKGMVRAYIEAIKGGNAPSKAFLEGSRAEFLRSSFGGAVRTSKLELAATRTFEELKGFTAKMAQSVNRIVADGLAKGIGPKELARNITKQVGGIDRNRARMIARTETIHAHAEGQLDALEDLGVEEVTALVEWSTAGDKRVCPTCASLQGAVFKLKDARGLIPRHPNCRCAWIPYVENKRPRSPRKAIDASIKAERPKKSLRENKRRSTWQGASLRVR